MIFRSSKAGLLVKIIFLILLAYAIFSLVHIQQQISETEEEVRTLTQQVADQKEINISLSNAIENSDDPSFIQDVAREKLDLVTPYDRIFYISN